MAVHGEGAPTRDEENGWQGVIEGAENERRENATSFRPSATGPRELFRPFPPPFLPLLPSTLAVQVYLGLINAYTHTRDPIDGGATGAEGNANCRYDFFNADFRPG